MPKKLSFPDKPVSKFNLGTRNNATVIDSRYT